MKKYRGLNGKDNFSETLKAHFILQTLKALGHLKLKNIVHRDVKPENILVNSNFMIKLGDFTLAKKIDHTETMNTSRSGTIPYLSPECVIKKTEIMSSQCEKLDLYSLGVVMYMLLFNKHPFNYKNNLICNEYTTLLENSEVDYKYDGVILTNCCKDFLSGLLEKNINKRFSYEQAVNHKWVLGMRDKLTTITDIFECEGEKLVAELNKENIDDSYFENYHSYEVNYDEKEIIDLSMLNESNKDKLTKKKRKRPVETKKIV